MKTYHITDSIYREMVKRAERYESCAWDCIDIEGGLSLTFALEANVPSEVELYDEDDNIIMHDFDMARFDRMATNLR